MFYIKHFSSLLSLALHLQNHYRPENFSGAIGEGGLYGGWYSTGRGRQVTDDLPAYKGLGGASFSIGRYKGDGRTGQGLFYAALFRLILQ